MPIADADRRDADEARAARVGDTPKRHGIRSELRDARASAAALRSARA
jgi:hypothetical protein